MRKLPHILLLFLLLSACTSKSQYDAMRRGLDSLNERNRSDQPFTAADVQPYVDFFDSHGTSNDQLLAPMHLWHLCGCRRCLITLALQSPSVTWESQTANLKAVMTY